MGEARRGDIEYAAGRTREGSQMRSWKSMAGMVLAGMVASGCAGLVDRISEARGTHRQQMPPDVGPAPSDLTESPCACVRVPVHDTVVQYPEGRTRRQA